ENLGACAGRNFGADATTGEIIFFFDDDAWLTDSDFLRRAVAAFDALPDLGIVQPLVHDPTAVADPERWIPRIRKGDPHRSSAAFSVWEGALLVRRSAFEAIGGFADELFYYHEGIELTWRCWDAGYRAWYGANLQAHHPAAAPTRHAMFYRMNARNRVWVARRTLPIALVPLYVGIWSAADLVKLRSNQTALSAWRDGWREGWTDSPGTRRPIRWSTVMRMARHGRPPIV
ncbi:MAG: glycosyltransferase, partial [Actinomycetes bacterium]